MARPDLAPGYDGWQALDPTPQEKSEGTACTTQVLRPTPCPRHSGVSPHRDHVLPSPGGDGGSAPCRGFLLRAGPRQSHQGGRPAAEVRHPLRLRRGERRRGVLGDAARWVAEEEHPLLGRGEEHQHQERGQGQQGGHHPHLQAPGGYGAAEGAETPGVAVGKQSGGRIN